MAFPYEELKCENSILPNQIHLVHWKRFTKHNEVQNTERDELVNLITFLQLMKMIFHLLNPLFGVMLWHVKTIAAGSFFSVQFKCFSIKKGIWHSFKSFLVNFSVSDKIIEKSNKFIEINMSKTLFIPHNSMFC